MKIKYGLILATMLSTSVMAQAPMPTLPPAAAATPETNAPPAVPAVSPDTTAITANATNTNTPPTLKARKSKKKHKAATAKKETPATEMPAPSPLITNEPAVVIVRHAVIRAQSHINSEIVGRLSKGDTVTILEVVTLKHPKTDEPARWARIAMPSTNHVWINTSFIDATNQTVIARKLNLRSGPGENYSIIGRLQKGDAVKTLDTKGGWTQIEAPTNAYAFVAAHLLMHKEPEATPPVAAPAPAPVPSVVEPATPIASTTTETGTNSAAVPATVPPVMPVPLPAAQPAEDQPLPKRIVEREGIVGGTVSIQAPSHYELKSLDNGNVMDYLYSDSPQVLLKRYKGLTVLVSGEEELDERWPNTPVLTIQRIQLVK